MMLPEYRIGIASNRFSKISHRGDRLAAKAHWFFKSRRHCIIPSANLRVECNVE
jgi:hypothetical protein